MEQLLSVTAEMTTHAKNGAWKRIEQLNLERGALIKELESLDLMLGDVSETNRIRWLKQLETADRLHQEAIDFIRQYQEHINNELKALAEQKSYLISSAHINPKGQRLSTHG